MPKYRYGRYGIEIRSNEHNHKGQKAHVHIYIRGEEVALMLLDGTLLEGSLRSADYKIIVALVDSMADNL